MLPNLTVAVVTVDAPPHPAQQGGMSHLCRLRPLRLLALALALVATSAVTALFGAPAPSITYEAKPGIGNERHIVFLTGAEEYRGEEGLPMLAKVLSQRHGFRCTVPFAVVTGI